ncbi:hypothetical protein OIS_04483 [Enterococcus faecium EnGen0035]|nr:hypothetical protein OIS_04483 [Enterococcus faecium EnGen0035]
MSLLTFERNLLLKNKVNFLFPLLLVVLFAFPLFFDLLFVKLSETKLSIYVTQKNF